MPVSKDDKIKSLKELCELVSRLKAKNKTVVHCHGVFDLIHPGHIKHLEASKKLGDVLVVTLTRDEHVDKGPGRPVFNEYLRAQSLAALACVDYVAVNEWPQAVETIRLLRPDVYVKGPGYVSPEDDVTGGIVVEREAAEEVGGRIHFTDEVTFSSSALLNSFFGVFSEGMSAFLSDFKAKYSADEIVGRLKSLQDLKVLVIGDAIIDEYHYCRALGKSPKENIISTKFLSAESFPGGAIACANHVAGFCGDVHLVTCLGGTDSKEAYILDRLKPNIRPKLFQRQDGPTVTKRRFVDPAFLTKLFEISFLDDHPLPAELSRGIAAYLESAAADYDLVLVCDFGHGFLDRDIIGVLEEKARFMAVNTQTNSANVGYNLITKYRRADYICVDEPEIRLAARSKYGSMNELIPELAESLHARGVAVTRGHAGAVTHDRDTGFHETPVFSGKVVDRVGAGDAFLSVTSPMACKGHPMDLIGFVGNAVGAIKVGIVCNRSSVEPVPLYKFIGTMLK